MDFRSRSLVSAVLAAACILIAFPALHLPAQDIIPKEYQIPQGPPLPPAPLSSLPEGTRMMWEDLKTGKRERGVVGRPSGLILNWTWEGQPRSSVGHLCEPCAQVNPYRDWGESEFAKMYPLQVGNTVQFERRLGDIRLRDRIEVIATQRITVPLGTFNTFIIRHRVEAEGSPWRAERWSWYAPDVGWIVKFVSGDNQGRESSWAMVRVN